jgi:hypothetical protein
MACHGFEPRPVSVGFEVNKMAMEMEHVLQALV